MNDRQIQRNDLALAVSLDFNDFRHPMEGWQKDYLRSVYPHPGANASCHNTAKTLREIMGQGQESCVGGAGLPQRRLAVEHGVAMLEDEQRRCIVSIKGTAGNNGHSFSLVADGEKMDVLEAWGAGGAGAAPGDLHALLDQLRAGLTRDQAKQALRLLASGDVSHRDRGYTSLSIAYPSSLGFEEKSGGAERDIDANISLVVQARQLKSAGEIREAMQSRLTKIDELKVASNLRPQAAVAV